MLSNIIVAATNITCIAPIYTAICHGDIITAAALTFVSIASFTSHLVENHKHGMKGIGTSKKTSYFLNRLDVIGCWLVISRFAYLFLEKYGFSTDIYFANKYTFLMYIIPYLFGISEYDKYNPTLKTRYVICHGVWHLSIFIGMNHFLNKFIY